MARTAMTIGSQQGKGKKLIKKKPKKRSPLKNRKSFTIRKPNITQSQSAKRKKVRHNNMVMKEIKFYQRTTGLLMSKAPFIRFVRDIVQKVAKNSNSEIPRFTAQSLEALQEVLEVHITTLIEASYNATRHAKRITLYENDIRLVNKIKEYNL